MNWLLKFDSSNVLVICRKKGKNNLSVITVLSLFPLSAQPCNMVVNGELTMLMRNREFSLVQFHLRTHGSDLGRLITF